MRLPLIGDVLGRSGRAAVIEQVALLHACRSLDFLTVGGENSVSGLGLTEALSRSFCGRSVTL